MRYPLMASFVLASGLFLGCRAKDDSRPDVSQTQQPTSPPDAKTTGSNTGAPGADTTNLPKDGPGDPALTYDVVKSDPAKYRGKRVTWAFAPLSSEGKRIMCALDMNEAIGPRHAGIYVVEFALDKEVGDAFHAAAFQAGSTITATVAGSVDQFLAVRDAKGERQKEIPKVNVPLLVHPAFKAGAGEGGKGKSKG
ncbi:MAG: hypothetical protein ACJ8F7_22430 [Gemmataceae bacterium]